MSGGAETESQATLAVVRADADGSSSPERQSPAPLPERPRCLVKSSSAALVPFGAGPRAGQRPPSLCPPSSGAAPSELKSTAGSSNSSSSSSSSPRSPSPRPAPSFEIAAVRVLPSFVKPTPPARALKVLAALPVMVRSWLNNGFKLVFKHNLVSSAAAPASSQGAASPSAAQVAPAPAPVPEIPAQARPRLPDPRPARAVSSTELQLHADGVEVIPTVTSANGPDVTVPPPSAAAGPVSVSKWLPKRFCVTGNPSDLLLEHLSNLLDAGIIRSVNGSDLASSSILFEVAKPTGALRCIHDLRFVNNLLHVPKLHLPGIKQLRTSMLEFSHFVSIDIQDAYYHVPLSGTCSRHLGVALPASHAGVHGCRFFVFDRLPFGLSPAPFVFQTVLASYIRVWRSQLPPHLRSLRFRALQFLDDIVIFGLCAADTAELGRSLADFLRSCNWALNDAKCNLTPAAAGTWIGLRFCLTSKSLMPDTRVMDYLRTTLGSAEMVALPDWTPVSSDAQSVVCGKLSWFCHSFPAAKPLSCALAAKGQLDMGDLRTAVSLIVKLVSYPSHLTLPSLLSHVPTPWVRVDASKHSLGMTTPHGAWTLPVESYRSYRPPPLPYPSHADRKTAAAAVLLHNARTRAQYDAARPGVDAVVASSDDKRPFSPMWNSPVGQSPSIALLEFLAVLWALYTWPPDVPMRLNSDSTVVIGVMRRAHSSGSALNLCSMFCSLALSQRTVSVPVSYVNTHYNSADLPSRARCLNATPPPALIYVAALCGIRFVPLLPEQ
jgi:hypothetical protein